MKIVKVTQDDFNEWLDLALQLWSTESVEQMQASLTNILQSPREAGFLIRTDDGTAIGFMNLSLRNDYVPGATQSPVAYVEGIYVKDEYRKQGVGKSLIHYAQKWALEHGCGELASDALLENKASYEFHTKVGFQEVERIVTFIKQIPSSESRYIV
ncbi:N-acetyltransferase [Fischerella thermalis CCMEE 5330]|uniref:Aminoglycoside N(6')-acetyltransferase type 1 n=1 Tax=Fischerella thermalis CCMEE 5330 TaxID=2019670 RepID=A0A2N6MEI8_9CYAN|nr:MULTISPECIES: aminoglycoside 6'-N-acetyltransferase [Fischerella]PMB45156.1 N-acetyltransferase [Fischerella thermalis CCMEE 5330]BAU07132.1 GCN5-related N-acetyltransferase [Fischerella sp. NIES-3754]